MPISFEEAKNRVCPNTYVTPGSKEHMDILELMKQSGHFFPEENTVPVPQTVRTYADLKPFRERPKVADPVLKGMSKHRWLSVDANRKAFDKHLETQRKASIPSGALEPPPQHLFWSECTPDPLKKGKALSKREWVASLIKNNES
jgi:hypothetical protein